MTTNVTIPKAKLDELVARLEAKAQDAAASQPERIYEPAGERSADLMGLTPAQVQLGYAIQTALKRDVGTKAGRTFSGPGEALTRAYSAVSGNKRFNTHETSGLGAEFLECDLDDVWNGALDEAPVASMIATRPIVNGRMKSLVVSSLPEPYVAAAAADCEGLKCTPSQPVGTQLIEHSASKWKMKLCFPLELEEDAYLAAVPEYTAAAMRGLGFTLDYSILRGDATISPDTANINFFGASIVLPAANHTPGYTAWDGLLHATTIDNVANCGTTAVNAGGFFTAGDMLTPDNITSLRGLMADAAVFRQWGFPSDPSRLRIFVDYQTYATMLNWTEVKTVDVAGPAATLFSGRLASIWGIPIVPVESLPLTDAQGRIDAVTPANNVYGTLLLVNLDGFRRGIARDLRVSTKVDDDCETVDVLFSWRDAFARHSTTGAASGIEAVASITGIAFA